MKEKEEEHEKCGNSRNQLPLDANNSVQPSTWLWQPDRALQRDRCDVIEGYLVADDRLSRAEDEFRLESLHGACQQLHHRFTIPKDASSDCLQIILSTFKSIWAAILRCVSPHQRVRLSLSKPWHLINASPFIAFARNDPLSILEPVRRASPDSPREPKYFRDMTGTTPRPTVPP